MAHCAQQTYKGDDTDCIWPIRSCVTALTKRQTQHQSQWAQRKSRYNFEPVGPTGQALRITLRRRCYWSGPVHVVPHTTLFRPVPSSAPSWPIPFAHTHTKPFVCGVAMLRYLFKVLCCWGALPAAPYLLSGHVCCSLSTFEALCLLLTCLLSGRVCCSLSPFGALLLLLPTSF